MVSHLLAASESDDLSNQFVCVMQIAHLFDHLFVLHEVPETMLLDA